MTVVLVHGNPEAAAVWDFLAPQIAAAGFGEPVRVSPPGFGAPLPDGFAITPAGYRAWLIAELEHHGDQIDLLGHDWGGIHVLGVAITRPDLIRSWASDAIGALHADYEWHPRAVTWQTPGAGERWVEGWLELDAADRVRGLSAIGMDAELAARLAPAFTAEMGQAILGLYRAARQPVLSELGAELSSAQRRPGLALLATADEVVGSERQRREAAARAGARVTELGGLGHWWMGPGGAPVAVSALAEFWSSLP